MPWSRARQESPGRACGAIWAPLLLVCCVRNRLDQHQCGVTHEGSCFDGGLCTLLI